MGFTGNITTPWFFIKTRVLRSRIISLWTLGCLLAAGSAGEAAPSPENAELVFGGGAGYFLQDVKGDIPRDDTPELTWTAGFDVRIKRIGIAYDLTVEPSYVYKDPRSPLDPFPLVTAYHHDFYLRWFFFVRPPAAFSVAGCLEISGIYTPADTPPDPFHDVSRAYASFQPGFYVGCDLRVLERLRTSFQFGFMRRVKPTRRTGDAIQTWYVLSDTWASHVDVSYWFWDFFGVGVRTSLYVDGPGEPKDNEKFAEIGYPPALCLAVFVGPVLNFTAFGSYF